MCVPTAFPYLFDAVRFKVYTNKGPETTNDFDVFDPCTAWNVQTTQNSSYQLGAGEAYRGHHKELRHHSEYPRQGRIFTAHVLFEDSDPYRTKNEDVGQGIKMGGIRHIAA